MCAEFSHLTRIVFSHLFKVTEGLHKIVQDLQNQALPKAVDPLALLYPYSY